MIFSCLYFRLSSWGEKVETILLLDSLMEPLVSSSLNCKLLSNPV